jgi:hypothetical protein
MKRVAVRAKRLSGAAVLLFLAYQPGCQSIADVPEVSFSAICDEYCDEMFNVCTGTAGQYEDRRTCLEVCTLLDKNADGSDADFANTVQCRISRLREAAHSEGATDRVQYCTQAGPGGGQSCTLEAEAPDCEGYCALYLSACDGDSKNPFNGADSAGTQTDCIDKCRAIPGIPSPGYTWQDGKDSRDTLGCRLYYASAAVVAPTEDNCTFAGIRPAGPCLDEGMTPSCSSFCLALSTACVGELKVYEDREQCEAVCDATVPGDRRSIDKVDTVGCRTAHAFNALLVSPTDHCPHTGPLGANVCGASGNCEAYCALAEAACPDEFAGNYSDNDDCVAQCAEIPGHDANVYSVAEAEKGGDTLQCRGLAVSQALAKPAAERDALVCGPVFGAAPCRD